MVGDSIWDMLAARRASFLGVGFSSGGYGTEELERPGLLRCLNEVGVRTG